MSGIEIKDLPDLPDEKADKLRRNWLLYFLPLLFSLLTYIIEDYVKSRDAKPCNDLNIRLLNTIDSTNKADIKFFQQQLKERYNEKPR